jgi:NADPH:quinone reductase-like Zn-dependent oxidoreductase
MLDRSNLTISHSLAHALLPVPGLQPGTVLIKLTAAALNHRDHFVRQGLYPGVQFNVPLCCDGCGIVVAVQNASSAQSKMPVGTRVVINPGFGWVSDPDGPEREGAYLTLGTSAANTGTLQTYMVAPAAEVFPTPAHLSDEQASAIGAAGLTAWRAVMIRSENIKTDRNILVTGIGGGVALFAMQFALVAGCNVWVTSSKGDKLSRAQKMGAKGGVLYTEADWDTKLMEMLPPTRKYLDAIIDGAGGDIVKRGVNMLRTGGTIVSYGMTLGPSIAFPMRAVFKQIKLVASGMGSRKDFAEMLECIARHKIVPVVSRVLADMDDLEAVDGFIRELHGGGQFGKLVIRIAQDGLRPNKL